MKDITIIGNISIDHLTLPGGTRFIMIGGGALNVGIGCKVAGVTPSLISVVGTDVPIADHTIIRKSLDTSGIAIQQGNSCVFEIVYDDLEYPPRIKTVPGVSSRLTCHACDSVTITNHLHICCRLPLDPEPVIKAWHGWWTSLSLDFIHSSFIDQFKGVASSLRYANYIFLNEEEFNLFAERIDISQLTAILIVTHGSRGVIAFRQGQIIHTQAAYNTRYIVDTTGAGDTFTGTFLGSVILGLTIDEALDKAAYAAAQSVQDYGVLHLLKDTELTV